MVCILRGTHVVQTRHAPTIVIAAAVHILLVDSLSRRNACCTNMACGYRRHRNGVPHTGGRLVVAVSILKLSAALNTANLS